MGVDEQGVALIALELADERRYDLVIEIVVLQDVFFLSVGIFLLQDRLVFDAVVFCGGVGQVPGHIFRLGAIPVSVHIDEKRGQPGYYLKAADGLKEDIAEEIDLQ